MGAATRANRVSSLVVCLLLATLVGCAAPATPQPSAGGEMRAVIGFTASKTGSLNVESTRQTNGLNLWIKQVNEAGGIKLKDGTTVTFEAKFYDDESNTD